jgi:hypothetical protein
MMDAPTPLRGSLPNLSRLACRRCDEETLHKFGRCIHCGQSVAAPLTTVDAGETAWAGEVRQRKSRRGVAARLALKNKLDAAKSARSIA